MNDKRSTASNKSSHEAKAECLFEEVLDSEAPPLDATYVNKHGPHSFSWWRKAACIGTMSFGEFIM